MENDQLNKEWERLGQELDQEMSDLPTVELSEKHQSIYQKRLVSNNMVELIIGILQIPILAIMILTIDEYSQIPRWLQLTLWFTTLIYVYPSIRLYRSIHFADPSTPTAHYLRTLVKRMNQYKVFQMISAFIMCFLLCESTFLVLKGFHITVDEVTYNGILNFPAEQRLNFVLIATGISLGFSLVAAASAYAMYWIFYKRRNDETKARLKMFE